MAGLGGSVQSMLGSMSRKFQFDMDFEVLAARWGALHDKGDSQSADALFPDLKAAGEKLIASQDRSFGGLEALMVSHANPWVRHCAAALLLPVKPETASKALA
jgi:hypothetical protein